MDVVVYCRFSTEMQNPKSCDDQEREVKAGLARFGIDAAKAIVIKDSAVSGTKVEREGFEKILARIRAGEAFILAVDDQSRLSRLDNALALVTDIVYAGGRFISVCEDIDTSARGWRLKVRVMELHHSTCSDETGSRVRRGQHGRVVSGLSAGDFPYGFESYPIDPTYAKNYAGRGPKPAMGIRPNSGQAKWVLWIFEQFALGRSINSIARDLTRRQVPRGHRAWNQGWYAPTIRAMLSNPKYVGVWTWGKKTTVRNSVGKKKQIAVSEDQVVVVERPELRIIPQELWEQVQQQLANLRQATGYKPGQPSRRPMLNYTVTYPTDLLMTLLNCGYCGGKMHHAGSGKHTYRQCVNSIDGRETCKEKLRISAAKARAVLLGFIADLLKGMPEWIATVVGEMRTAINEIQSQIPDEVEGLREQLRDAEKRHANLMAIAEGGGVDDVEAFMQRLRSTDDEAKQLRLQLKQLESLQPAQVKMPSDKWIEARLTELADTLASDEANTARLLRELIGSVRVFRVVPVGKMFGYQQLKFRISGWKAVRELLRGHVPLQILEVVEKQRSSDAIESPEFCLDVGGPHKLDIIAPHIAERRSQGIKWKDIAREFDLTMDSAYQCWRRYVKGLRNSAASNDDNTVEGHHQGRPEERGCTDSEHGAA